MTVLDTARELESRGERAAAAAQLELALKHDPTSQAARRALLGLLVRMGRRGDTLELWEAEMRSGAAGAKWTHDAIVELMKAPDPTFAGELARRFAAYQWASRRYPGGAGSSDHDPPAEPPEARLSVGKLEHDIAQFEYLRGRGILDDDFDAIIAAYRRIADRLRSQGITGRVAMEPSDRASIGDVYNRFVHLSDAPRLPRALGSTWDRASVEDRYLHDGPGLVVIDDFLSPEALDSVRRFCLESTVWTGNRYTDGRVGSFFMSGFSAPLLVQIADEVRRALPVVIGAQHPLRQLWGFKNAPRLAENSSIHADFAAVNVNFWITPETANLDATCGGLVVYDKAAPLSWDFEKYNRRSDLIRQYLRDERARTLRIPYRQNRAIIFNSDLFHATARLDFRPEYENRRINITMLYGDRADDRHHPPVTAEADLAQAPVPASGSAGVSHARGR